MNTHSHAPLVATSTHEAADTMISEGSPQDQTAQYEHPETGSIVEEFPRWSVQKEGYVAEFRFPTYMAGIEFVHKVAEIAEGMNHHPDIWVGWRNVRLAIMTHSRKAITTLDADFVRKVEAQ